MDNLYEPTMNLCLYGFCASMDSNICMANLSHRHWLSSTSDAEKSVRLHVGFPGSELGPSSSAKMLI